MTPDVLVFLAALGCVPHAEIVIDSAAPMRAYAVDHVVTFSAPPTANMLVHELWHVCQYQQRGSSAGNDAERARREVEARRVELLYSEHD